MGNIKMAALYSWGCRRTKNLGVDKILEKFILSKKTDDSEILEILKKLQPYPSYQKLASISEDKNPFSGKVIDVYWLGGEILKNFGDLLPFHNFETLILLLSAEKNEKILQKLLAEAEDCCVMPGIVKEILKNQKAVVEYRRIEYRVGKFHFGVSTIKEIKRKFLKDLKVGDLISFHLGYGREKITASKKESLEIWTKKTLDILNKK